MRRLHFAVASIHREGARLFLGGRNCGDGLALADVLRGPGGTVRVERILTYRRYLNTLGPGLTGELEVSGGGADLIQPGTELVETTETELPPVEVLGQGEFHVEPA